MTHEGFAEGHPHPSWVEGFAEGTFNLHGLFIMLSGLS